MKKVAIIILNYKTWEDTLYELNLCHEKLKIDYENMVVVDNCSPNKSANFLRKEASKLGFIFIESDSNKGYAAGNNVGLRYAYEHGYKWAWILNNDIIIEDKSIVEKIIRVFEKDNLVAVVNPDIYAPDGHMFNRDAIRLSFFDYTIGMLNYRKKGRKIQDRGGYSYIYRPQGCCMMVDLKKMHEINYMDENTFLYGEEPILAERLLQKDYKCACCIDTSIIHNHSKTVKGTFDKNKIQKMNNASFSYYLKEYRKFNPIQIVICCLFNRLKLFLLKD